MKKAGKIIIPILLALVIVLGTAWYLFIYDREFTRDMFLHSARFFHEQGNTEIAEWLYDCAYRQSEDNDAVAIELSRQHASVKNYVQAEKALTNAISNKPSVNLYVSLINLYLDQDKVMDAVELMDTLCANDSSTDPSIREELIQMRPQKPQAESIPNENDTELLEAVKFKVTSGTLYINSNGAYPTYSTNSYKVSSGTKTVFLNEGNNQIYALAISDKGIPSELLLFSYELNSNRRRLEEVNFSDPVVEAEIRKQLQADENRVIMTNELWAISELTIPEGTKSIADLYHMIGLEKLTIDSPPANQLSNLVHATKLKELSITGTPITQEELNIIGGLLNLNKLTLSNCSLVTINGLENLSNLEYLNLSSNTIVDITPITGLTKLTELNLNGNSLKALSGISQLSRLSVLDASNNVITSLSDLINNYSLTELVVAHNKLTDLDEVTQLHNLLTLDFSYNSVSTLPTWDSAANLVTINGKANNITDLKPLVVLEKLNNVLMDDNKNLSSVECLADCKRLVRLEVWGTKVKDVRALNDMGVVIKYDPT